MAAISKPCENCPWKKSNQGKRTPWGFYSKSNLTRLWNEIRGGGAPQSCHPTDPNHPDHIAAGAKPGSTPRECPGSVILVIREMQQMAAEDGGTITPKAIDKYKAKRKKGLKGPTGIMYWVISRFQFGGVAFFGGPKLPDVDVSDKSIGLPEYLKG